VRLGNLPGRFRFQPHLCRELAGNLATTTRTEIQTGAAVRSRPFTARPCNSPHLKGANMPTYQNSTPPYALSSGDIGFSFNDEAFPAANTAGSQFALPSYTGISDGGTALRWQTIFGTAPSAVNIVFQGAMNDVDAEYQTIDTTTAVAGEGRSIPNNASGTTSPATGTVQAKFIRAKVISSTGGPGLTV
jgi:hypothetical protein